MVPSVGPFLGSGLAPSGVQAQEKKAEAKSSQEALGVYSDAASFQNNKAFKLAAEEWEKFLKQFPNDPLAGKARHYLGICLMQEQEYAGAVEAFQIVVSKYPVFELTEEAYLQLGWCTQQLAKQGQAELYAKSAAILREQLKKFPSGKGKRADQALFFLAESLYYDNKKDEAIPVYQAVVKDHKESTLRADALYALGTALEDLGKHRDAGDVYEQFLSEFAKHTAASEVRMRKAETVLQTALAAQSAGRVEEARPLLAQAEKMFLEAAKIEKFAAADYATWRAAFTAFQREDFDRAADLYAAIPNRFPRSTHAGSAVVAAGRSYFRAGKLPQAIEWLNKAVAAGNDDSPEAAHWLARVHLRGGRPAEAEQAARGMIAKAGDGPFAVQLQMDMADAIWELPDRQPEALQLYAEIAERHPDDQRAPRALYSAAFAALRVRQYELGARHAAAFLEKYGKDALVPDVKHVAAECHLNQKDYEAAAAVYSDLIATQKDHPDAELWRVRLGESLFRQKKHEEVVATLARELPRLKNPAHQADAYYLIGSSQLALDRLEDASKALQAALGADPQAPQADETLLTLARVQRRMNQLDAARQTVAKVIQDYPQSGSRDRAHFLLGEYSSAAGEFTEAIPQYDRVLVDFATSSYVPASLYGKGWAQLKSKDYRGAGESFSKILADHSQHALAADAQFARGMSRRLEGQAAAAVADIQAYLKTNPPLPQQSDARLELGLAQVAAQDYAAARKALESILAENPKYASIDRVMYELAWAMKSDDKADDAIAMFGKLAASHPESEHAAEAFHHVGEYQYQKGAYLESLKSYGEAKRAGRPAEIAEKATHKLGWACYQLKRYDEALKEFDEQLANFSDGALATDGAFMKGECLFKLEKYDEALAAYEGTRDAIQSEKVADVVKVLLQLHAGQSAAQLNKWQKSLDWLATIPDQFPDSQFVAEALFERGRARQNLDQLDESMADYEKAATKSRGGVGARSRFMLGEVRFAQKEFDLASKEFQKVMFGFGGEAAPDDVKNWQAKAGFEAGRCAEVQIKDAKDGAVKTKLISDAKKFYGYVVSKHAKHELVAQAKQRLETLQKP